MKKTLKLTNKHFKKHVIGVIELLARRVGMERVSDMPAVDFTGLGMGAESALTRAGGRKVLIEQPLELMRGIYPVCYRLDPKGGHPHVLEALFYIGSHENKATESPLDKYFNVIKAERAIDIIGVKAEKKDSRVTDYSAGEATLPWASELGEKPKKARKGWLSKDVEEHLGSSSFLSSKVESHFFYSGPVVSEFIEFEKTRIRKVVDSIKKYGYDPNLNKGTPQLRVTLLKSGGSECLVIDSGQHRAAALAALGYTNIPVVVLPKIIRREDVHTWPAVVAGNMTEQEALQVFDRLIAGELPEYIQKNWVDQLDSLEISLHHASKETNEKPLCDGAF